MPLNPASARQVAPSKSLSFGLKFFACVALLALSGCGDGSGSSAGSTGSGSPPPTLAAGIQPLTQVNAAAAQGYFVDPLPVHLAKAAGSYLPSIVGTTHGVLDCTALAAGCYSNSQLTITTGASLLAQLPAGAKLVGYQNNNAYQDNAGNWQMATTVTVNNPAANPQGLAWNVILHASPAPGSAVSTGGVPLSWVSDSLLIGSLSTQGYANYDGKYIEDNNQLYLIYSRRLQTTPTAQDGIVAQLLVSAQQPAAAGPITLLAPENNSDAGYNSELFNCGTSNGFKLIETGNIAVVAGKYAMAYSTGSYESPCYKVGIAWSDTLTGTYKKILQQDSSNIWQNPTPEPEVLYLIQAQRSAWPNYVAASVQGPGVPSLVQYPAGTWYLYFAGYSPTSIMSGGMFDPSTRQPYALKLNVSIPANANVASTANTDLAGWITSASSH